MPIAPQRYRPAAPAHQRRRLGGVANAGLFAVLLACVAVVVSACGGSAAPPAGGGSSTRAPTPTTSSTGGSNTTGESGTSATTDTTSASVNNGEQIFNSAGCATCHTLAAAGATGDVGPDLDEVKLSVATIESQVAYGAGTMPPFAGQLTDAQIRAVAKYVASVDGRSAS